MSQATPEITVQTPAGDTFRGLLIPPPPGTTTPVPLVVFLHGAGERGSDNHAQLAHFPERMAEPEYRERFPCYLLAMQCPSGERWSAFNWSRVGDQPLPTEPTDPMQAVIAAIRQTVADHPIDARRIYLTGLSMGGFGSWELAARKPDWFAAVAPICGGGDPGSASAYTGLPLWAWHDEADPAVPVEYTRRMVEAARDAGALVRYNETEGYGHASWTPAYAADNVPAWLFEHARDEPAEELAALQNP